MVVNNPAFFLSHRLPVARAAKEAGYDVHLATPPGDAVGEVLAAGIEWHPIRLGRSSQDPRSELASMADLYRLYSRLAPGIVHHVTPKPVLYGTPMARRAGVRAVVNAISGMGHVFADREGRRRQTLKAAVSVGYRLALRHPRMRVIFQNGNARSEFLSRGWVRPHEAVLIRGSGVDVAEFTPAPAPPPGVPLTVLPARMLRTKGVVEFVEAARMLKAQGVAARFALIGDPDPGNPADIPAEQLKAWEAEGVVEHWGHRRDMHAVLAGAHVACLPSYLEGLPKALIEAAACGLPIVTTDVPGCREVVTHGGNGLLVPAADAPALAAALRRLIGDEKLRGEMGRAGRARAVAEFSLDSVIAAHLGLYAELDS
jgi:glycosyltransferase involved in cell wall biosynthesis